MITSLNNPQIKHVAALQSKHRYREEQGQFVAEGIKMVRETPDELLERIYISESFVPDSRILSWLEDKKTETVSEKVFRGLSMTRTPQGILAVVRMPSQDVGELLKKSTFLILESIQDPGNLGTMVRTAGGAGVDAIFMSKTCVDIYNPKVVRSTMGSLYRVPFVYVEDLAGLMGEMKKNKITLFAAHLKGEKYYYEADFSGKCAFLIGNEANGLTWETASMADTYIKIPMSGQVESLNAAMAAGILMYDMRRQKAMALKKTAL